jgi:hypothetical protein
MSVLRYNYALSLGNKAYQWVDRLDSAMEQHFCDNYVSLEAWSQDNWVVNFHSLGKGMHP